MKQYAGAYVDGFEWPQPILHSDEDNMDEIEGAFAVEGCNRLVWSHSSCE